MTDEMHTVHVIWLPMRNTTRDTAGATVGEEEEESGEDHKQSWVVVFFITRTGITSCSVMRAENERRWN